MLRRMFFWITLISSLGYGQTRVLTWHNDNARTGQNLQETILTPANVNSSTFGRLFTLAVDGKVDAQPLYVPGLTIGGAVHNVLYVVTEHDSVFAFDADNGTLLKQVTMLVANEVPSDARNCSQVTPEIGITGTPAIDLSKGAHGTMYLVAMSKDSSSNYHHRLHSLDLTTLADQVTPVEIAATFPGAGVENTFVAAVHKARPGLLIGNGQVYTSWGSHCDAGSYAGWVISYNEDTLARTNVVNLVPNGNDGGIWAAGAGPAMDTGGNVYLLTGNGTFDVALTQGGFPNKSDYGNAFVRLTGALGVTDYFTMSNTTAESSQDADLGSSGLILLPSLNDSQGQPHSLAVGAGKDGNIYVVDQGNMGKFNSNTDNIYQLLMGALPGSCFSTPAWFNGTLFYGDSGGTLKAFSFVNGQFSLSKHSANSFGYPGTTPSISANGTSSGIVWAAENSAPAVLHAYDASDVSRELYNSNQAPNSRDQFGSGNKFIVPTVVNGKVYVGTTNGVGVFGLLSAPADFSLGIAPGSRTISAGSSTTYTVSATAMNGFSSAISFTASGLPSGATASFNPPSVSSSGSTTLTVNTTAGAIIGGATITVTGTSGVLTHTTSASLTITGNSGPPSTVSVTPSSGSGASQIFAFVFSDPAGATNIVSAQLDVNASLTSSGACYLYYSRGANAIYLANDSGSFTSSLTVGSAGTMQNSQCTVNAGSSSMSVSGNSLTLNLALSFQPAFAGSKNVYMEVQNPSGDSGWAQRGAWTVSSGGTPQPPSTVSVTPSSGSGTSQTFGFVFSDLAGATNIVSAQMDVNASLTSSGACYLYYSRSANAIYLANDSGSFTSSLTVGSAGTMQNSQCILNAGSSSMSISGNSLTLNLALSFQPAFAGAKNVYMEVQNPAGDSGWAQRGTWTAGGGGTPQPPSTVSVTPSSGSGTSQTFGFVFSDPAGATNIVSAQMDVNASLTGSGACYLYYSRGANAIYLANDSGSFTSSLTVGSAGTMQNSQCTVNAGSSSMSIAGNSLTLNLALSFQPVFAGAKNVYMEVQNASGDSGWSLRGTWTVGSGGAPQPPSTVSVTPSSGSGSAQTFQFFFSDPAGATNIVSAQLDVNASLTASNSCYLYYSRAANAIYLASNAGSFSSSLTVGSAGTMQNSQCTVNAGSSSMSISGNTLTLNLALSFQPAFSGAKNVYMEVQNPSLDSGWTQRGTWNIP